MEKVTTRLRQKVFVVLAFLVAYPIIKAWLKRRELKRLASVYPYSKKYDNFLLGFVPAMKRNFGRLYHFREEHFPSKEVKTVQFPVPFFSDKPAILMTRDPELIKYITKDAFDRYVKAPMVAEAFGTDNGLGSHAIFITAHGSFHPEEHKLWKLQRRTGVSLFTNNFLATTVNESLEKNMQKMIRNIDAQMQNGLVDMKDQFYKLTVDVIADIAFDESPHTLDLNDPEEPKMKFASALDEIFVTAKAYMEGAGYQLFGRNFPRGKEYFACRDTVENFIGSIVKSRNMLDDAKIQLKNDVLSKFMYSMRADGQKVSEKLLVDFTFSLFLAGRDTTGVSLSWIFYLLSTHPETQEKVHHELVSNNVNDFETLIKLPYLDAVIKETLRLFPPVPRMSRAACCDDTLPNGVQIKKGTEIHAEIFSVNRDPAVYDEPLKFKPERWLERGNVEPWEYPIFMSGPRICLGKDFSFFETKVAMVKLLKKYRFTAPKSLLKTFDASDVTLRQGQSLYEISITLAHKGPLELEVSPRN